MTPSVNSFDVRKFSEKNLVTGRWTHYPQRSEISVNFLSDNGKVILSITWRTSTWKRLTLHRGQNPTISVFAKYPSVGYKQCDYKGNVLHRFQISFKSQQQYDEFCSFLTDELGIMVHSSNESSLGCLPSQRFCATSSQDYSISQTIPSRTKQNQYVSPSQLQLAEPIRREKITYPCTQSVIEDQNKSLPPDYTWLTQPVQQHSTSNRGKLPLNSCRDFQSPAKRHKTTTSQPVELFTEISNDTTQGCEFRTTSLDYSNSQIDSRQNFHNALRQQDKAKNMELTMSQHENQVFKTIIPNWSLNSDMHFATSNTCNLGTNIPFSDFELKNYVISCLKDETFIELVKRIDLILTSSTKDINK